jgi:hypothetical protein
LLIAAVLFLAWGCSKKTSPTAKRQPKADHPEKVEPEVETEEPVKAATPEDPGPMATVIAPLAILKGEAKPLQTKPEAAVRQEPLSIDHPVYIQPGKSKHLLHNIFSVNNHAQFAFLVPPHQDDTRLRGNFRSFTKRSDPDSTSDRTANVDLMLLNEQEFNEFLHGQPQSVTYELDPSHNQMVDWRVPTTYGESQTYHLVFSNSAGGTKTKFVEADFTLSFE